ncbi:transcription repressor NadR [Azotosporobacter soli]|uniref:transcription repressor NadR n=1 Tax=Azotosporobacter soli TaxID=3055040 RepID=UPI0031FE7DA3
MDAKQRRQELLRLLEKATTPLTGTQLARELGVSRQVIVGDFALLRATGAEVYATPQGYLLPKRSVAQVVSATLACKHARERLHEELAIIIDNGGKVVDVVVEHPLYGEIKATLMLSTRRELNQFLAQLSESNAEPLSAITDGVHLHTVEVPDAETLERIKHELKEKGILLN